MSTRRKTAKPQKERCVRYGASALRRAMREGARLMESVIGVYVRDARRLPKERAKWLRRAREAVRYGRILRHAAGRQ